MKRWTYALLPVAILLSLIGWRIVQKKAGMAAEVNQQSAKTHGKPSVAVTVAKTQDICQIFEATGSIEAPLNVKIAPKITGKIEYLTAREGDRVKQGQVLVRIDPSEVDADVRQQRAAVAEARYRLAQAQLTENPNNVSVNNQIRQQRAGMSSANADYKQVSANYEALVSSADAAVTDARGKVASANAQISNAKAGIRSAEANLNNARSKYNRVMELYKQGFIAAQEVDDAKATVSVQESALDVAKGQLQSATATLDSAIAQKESATHQASIVRNKGQADIEASRARMIQARASTETAVANNSQKLAYRQSIAALSSSVDAAEASLSSAIARRADTRLVSPLDGFVTGRYADPGAMAVSAQPVLSVQFMKQVWATISVPEEICARIHIGQSATVAFDAYPDKKFSANVIQINPSADPQSRQFTVRVILSNAKGLFKPGMFARVAIETDRIPHATVVPREAVQHDKDGDYLMLVDASNKVHRCQIVTGASDSTYIAIKSGLVPGDKVVTMSASALRDGQTIRTGGKHQGRRK